MKEDEEKPQSEKIGMFGRNSLKMYIPVCGFCILAFVSKNKDDLSFAMNIIVGYFVGLVVWTIAAISGYFDKKDKE